MYLSVWVWVGEFFILGVDREWEERSRRKRMRGEREYGMRGGESKVLEGRRGVRE